VWSGDAKTGKNPLFQAILGGFWGFPEEKKGPHMTELEKFIHLTFYLLINLDKFSLVKFLKSAKKCKVDISKLLHKVPRALDHKLKVFVCSQSSFLSLSLTKVSLVLARFSSTSGRSWCMNLITLGRKAHKRHKSAKFKRL
jgi:hypothetical protein